MASIINKLLKVSMLSVVTISSLNASDELGFNLGNGWKASSEVRALYNNVDYTSGTNNYHGVYTSAKASILTPTYNGFSAKMTLGGVTDFGINTHNLNDGSNFVFDGTENKSFGILQELYISYKNDSHSLSIGRQEFSTPLIDADDYYIFANSFEVVNYTNTALENFAFHLGYSHKMSGVWDSGANGTEFHSMSDSSFVDARDKKNANDSGVFYGGIDFSKDSHSAKLWNYYAKDLYNIVLAEYAFSSKIDSLSYDVGVQITDYKEVGDLASHNFTDIDYTVFAAKFNAQLDNGLDFSTGITKFTNGKGQGATQGAWGGFAGYTGGFIFGIFEMGSLQDSVSAKAQVGFDLGKIGLNNTWIGYRYNYYNLDSKVSNGQESMQTNGIQIAYDSSHYSLCATFENRALDNESDANAVRLLASYKF